MIYLSSVCFLSIEFQHLANEYAHNERKEENCRLGNVRLDQLFIPMILVDTEKFDF